LGGAAKRGHDSVYSGPIVRARTEVAQRQVSIPIEDEVATHLRQVELLRTPGLSPQDETDVAPDRPWWRNCHWATAPKAQMLVTDALGVGKPQEGMPGAFGEALQLIGLGKRDHCHSAPLALDLLVELPQLREMLLAEESTKVAEQNQDGRPAKQFARAEDLAIDRHQIEVEIDPHRTMMRVPEPQSVIRITEQTPAHAVESGDHDGVQLNEGYGRPSPRDNAQAGR
jgi:hypothetical protein